ncbi:unnamed protein product [Rotaria sp. Silwood1]|nr:unnamed protein product [Rotaria sp. Silwood1]
MMDSVHSWWPWRSSSTIGKCILRTQDGWIKRPCNEEQAFICERDMNRQSIPLTARCGNVQPTTILSTKRTTTTVVTTTTTTIMSSTQHATISFIHHEKIALKNIEENFFIEQSSSTIKNKVRKTTTNFIDPNILAAILIGIAIVIFIVNVFVCCICKRRVQDQSKCKTQKNESNSSFIHEELQHSLMQHLYHEQTNTISSTSTSSSSSKHSQSKSNDTTTTSTNLFQLSSPVHPSNLSQSNTISTPLCYRNPHIGSDTIDYHVYETIPSENSIYTFCTSHSAFKPVVQSNTRTIRPFLPRTNIHHQQQQHSYSSQQSYDTIPSIPPNTTVVMPICCHHYSSQCSIGTLKQHVLPSSTKIATQEQVYTRSESIV